MFSAPGAHEAGREFLALLETEVYPIFGFGMKESQAAQLELSRMKSNLKNAESSKGLPTDQEIQEQIDARIQARKDKKFDLADQIRKDLEARGVILKDGPTGTSWQFK
jgi:cysteinyl-tRNA synthetase